ncbi:hypothetical protein ISG33_00055 [Glaciecola sp. MH2013]|uniref:hypothetical protein n=1 Tax=Glaciecola sp. MH2013 TaxID=2785524 RepID=UPI00189D2A42|nr:hypothetical protein [Glaciecola sp. MH2013]MBF7071788.1 hypothetical protein [Glaciecola sp. MH2013]
MTNEKFVDPRLQAKEALFQQLHLSTFDTMSYAQAIFDEVNNQGFDIDAENESFQQLLRDYEVTKAVASISDSPLEALCERSDAIIKNKQKAFASTAQLLAAATNTLNHWRILSEVPEDLRNVDEVSATLKANYQGHLNAWNNILAEL